MAELITALDLPDAPRAVELLDQLPEGIAVKVGSVLMTAAGPGFVRTLTAAGYRVFLDLKWHDIPHTVAGAIRSARGLGVDMVTVHALGGSAMMAAAVEAAEAELSVVAVTVLTSHDQPAVEAVVGRRIDSVADEVERLAELALGAGVAGLVASPEEVGRLAPLVGAGRLVVPGIRRREDARGDQVRVAPPEVAVAAGATDLVVGRPIIAAAEPAAAWRAYREAVG